MQLLCYFSQTSRLVAILLKVCAKWILHAWIGEVFPYTYHGLFRVYKTFPVCFSRNNFSQTVSLILAASRVASLMLRQSPICSNFLNLSLFLFPPLSLRDKSSFLEMASPCIIQVLWSTMHAIVVMWAWSWLLSFFLNRTLHLSLSWPYAASVTMRALDKR